MRKRGTGADFRKLRNLTKEGKNYRIVRPQRRGRGDEIGMEAKRRMTEGPIAGHILRFAWPILLGNVFQQLYNVADTLIVGNLLGNKALAAVSSTGSLVFLMISLFSGISLGAGVVISRYFGARETKNMRLAVHTDLCFGLAAGVFLTVAGTLLTPKILVLMDTPADVMELSVAYLQTYYAGAVGLVMYNTCTGIMQAVGDSRHPLQYLIISSCLNVVLDIVMITAFHLGVRGAALATIMAQFVSVVLCLIRLLRVREEYRVSVKELRVDWGMLKTILRFGLPSGLQNSIIAIANVVVQSNINYFGEMAMAGCGAYSKVEGFGFLPINSFTMALTTFVGQNLGAGEYDQIWASVLHPLRRGHRRDHIPPVALPHPRLHRRAGGHRHRRPAGARVLALLLPPGVQSRRLRRPARGGKGRGAHGHDAGLLVRGPRHHPGDPDPHFSGRGRHPLGLPLHLEPQHHRPAPLLLQG